MDLSVLRNAIELYTAEHDGKAPTASITQQLTQYSNFAGTGFSVTKDPASGLVYGPYLKEVPPMPVGAKKGETGVHITAVAADVPPQGAVTDGWWYNSATQDLRANLVAGDVDDDGVVYNSY